MSAPLRIGTRGSALALWQTEHVRAQLHAAGCETVRVEIRTTGDMVQSVPLSQIGSRALFTRQIDDAMLEGRIDLAVHSLKDLPTRLPDGIALIAVGEREDPRDALVGRGPVQWGDLPEGAVLATSSLRRRAQLLHLRPDLRIRDIRGNVDTRLAKLDASTEWSAILLAVAGLVRLGLSDRIGQRLPPELMLPAPGQGALAVTARTGDAPAAAAVARAVHHTGTALAVAAERAFLRTLEGGCQVPVAAHAEPDAAGRLRLHGRVVSLGGERGVEGIETGLATDELEADALGVTLADRLLGEGAASILAEVRGGSVPAVPEP
ncbi:MAG: hydroxymethylbilane synthase [Gemmatimonadales bacterium]